MTRFFETTAEVIARSPILSGLVSVGIFLGLLILLPVAS